MATTVLSLIQDCCRELKLSVPTSVYTSQDKEMQLLLALLNLEGREVASKYVWPVLNKEYTFSTSNGVAAYALPADFDYECFSTQWDRSNHWKLRGPLPASEWQQRKSGINTVLPQFGFRVKGASSTPFYLEPTPTTVNNLVFEYQSTNWVRPATSWAASTAFAAGSYCFSGENVYQTTAGGTTGSTAPTHSTGTVSDGAVSWTFVEYNRVLSDTDILTLPDQVLKLGVKWRWKRENGFEYETYREEAIGAARRAVQSGRSAPEIPLTHQGVSPLINYHSIPDGGYGS